MATPTVHRGELHSHVFSKNNSTVYEIDNKKLHRLFKSHYVNRFQDQWAKEKVVEDNWILPDVYELSVPWKKVRDEAAEKAAEEVYYFPRMVREAGIHNAVGYLVQTQYLTRIYRASFRRQLSSLQVKAAAERESTIRMLEMGEAAARVTRDLSAAFVVIGVTALTGGAAAGVAGSLSAAAARQGGIALLGASLDAAMKYQDVSLDKDPKVRERAAKAAASEFVGKFLIGLIPGGKAGDKLFFTILKTQAEMVQGGVQANIEGKDLNTAVVTALGKATGPLLNAGVGKLFATAPVNKLLARVSYPMSVKMQPGVGTPLLKFDNYKFFKKEVVVSTAGKVLNFGVGKAQSAGEGAIAGAMNKKPPKPKTKDLKQSEDDTPSFDKQDMECINSILTGMPLDM